MRGFVGCDENGRVGANVDGDNVAVLCTEGVKDWFKGSEIV